MVNLQIGNKLIVIQLNGNVKEVFQAIGECLVKHEDKRVQKVGNEILESLKEEGVR